MPVAGVLPAAVYSSGPVRKSQTERGDVEDLRAHRQIINAEVLSALKDLPFSADIAPDVAKDVELGAMSEPCLLTAGHIKSVILTRRIPVREERASANKNCPPCE